jgi:hypothetical protein
MMPIDLVPPPIWLPPKPAIVRPADDIRPPRLAMLPGIMPVVQSGKPAVVVDYRNTYVNGTSTATPSFASCDIGTAASDRLVVVGAAGEGNSGVTLSGVTIGGNAATQAAAGAFSENNAGLFYLRVASGTTATIAVTFSSAKLRSGIVVYALYNVVSDTPYDTNTAGASATSVSVTSFASPAKGAVIGVASKSSASISGWTNLTLDSSVAMGGTNNISGASKATSTGSGGETITATSSGSSRCQIAVASWR